MRVGAPTKTEREARGGNLGNCETMEDADVLALDGAGGRGRRTAVWTKHEALPPVHGILRLGAYVATRAGDFLPICGRKTISVL